MLFKRCSFNKALSVALLAGLLSACQEQGEQSHTSESVNLITLDPGHFHAALVQKTMYPQVSPVVHVYATDNADLDLHLSRIESFNQRAESPTAWKSDVYRGNDFFNQLLEHHGSEGDVENVVMLSGNNQKKTEYIASLIKSGLHVYADKPMVIDTSDFELLKESFALAEKKGVLLYDIMTERFEITSILQQALVQDKTIFGELVKGSAESPAIIKQSTHNFSKVVSGKQLIRPDWFFDVNQEGEGIVDIATHLVDLVQWTAFPEKIIHYQTDINVYAASHWPTVLSAKKFKNVTGLDEFPDFLQGSVKNGALQVYSNGDFQYELNGVHVKVATVWNYEAPEGDTFDSMMQGTKAKLIIQAGELIIENPASNPEELVRAFKALEFKFPGISLEEIPTGWKVVIPGHYKKGHESHFAQVTEQFLIYLQQGKLPTWEVENMQAKYYVTTRALALANSQN